MATMVVQHTASETKPAVSLALNPKEPTRDTIDPIVLKTSERILRVIGRYVLKSPIKASRADEGHLKFLSVVYSHVKVKQPVNLCLPAFPFKSPNAARKVLGKLPDKAEEFALAHLNGLCLAIGDVYAPGAKLTIVSDGLVYNGKCFWCAFKALSDELDLLGVPDKDVWAYGEALRALAQKMGYDRLLFSRLQDLVTLSLPEKLDEMTYCANASNFRRALLNAFMRPDWDWNEVRQSEDICMTYRGYIKFLETDLEYVFPQGRDRSKSKYKRGIEYIAQQMLARGDVRQ
jgi:pyoverdine/dityrosine biosynthesis protein Dit1